MRVVLIPPDARPCNVDVPRALASIAGATLVTPPPRLLAERDAPADPGPVLEFLGREGARADALILSADALVHGGEAFSTDGRLEPAEADRRLERARETLAPWGSKTTILSSITPETFPCRAEGERALHGDLARWNALRDRVLSAADAAEKQRILARIPNALLQGFEAARERNVGIQRRLTGWLRAGVVAKVAFTYDEAAAGGPRAAELEALRRDTKDQEALFLAGADAAAALLTALAILEETVPLLRARIALSDARGMSRPAAGDAVPLRERLHATLRILGCVVDNEDPDFELFLHPPLAGARDLLLEEAPPTASDLARFVGWISESARGTRPVVLADCAHRNGADPHLFAAIPKDVLGALAGFAAAGTGPVTLGIALAHGVLVAHGKQTQRWNVAESLRFTKGRLLLDGLFPTIVRPEIASRCATFGIDRFDFGARAREIDAILDGRLHELADSRLPFGTPPFVADFPWRRLHEARIRWL